MAGNVCELTSRRITCSGCLPSEYGSLQLINHMPTFSLGDSQSNICVCFSSFFHRSHTTDLFR